MSGAVVQPDTGELTVLFTKPEAEAATAKLKSYFGVSCQLVKELHDKQAWKAMGYGSWAAYTKAEFDISRSRSYQLIKYAEIVAGLASVAQVPMDDMAAVLSEGAARAITPAEIAEVSTNVDTSADDRAEVAASAAVAAARARREAEAQKPPPPEPVPCSSPDCSVLTAEDHGLCPFHRGKALADEACAEQNDSEADEADAQDPGGAGAEPPTVAAADPVSTDADTTASGAGNDGGQADPASAPPVVTPFDHPMRLQALDMRDQAEALALNAPEAAPGVAAALDPECRSRLAAALDDIAEFQRAYGAALIALHEADAVLAEPQEQNE